MMQFPAESFRPTTVTAAATALPSQGVMTAGLFALMMAGFLDTVFTSDPADPVARPFADEDAADALVWLVDDETAMSGRAA